MAIYLYRLGRAAFIHRRLVLGIWIVLLVSSGLAAVTLSGPTSSAFSIPGTEAQQGIDTLRERFPELAADGATARVVFAAPEGGSLDEAANRATVADVLAGIQASPKVAFVTDPYTTGGVNPDGSAALAQVVYAVTLIDVTDADRKALDDAAQAGRATGLTVEMGGDAFQQIPQQGVTEIIGLAIAAFVLVITLGSLVAAGLPLLTAVVGIGTSVGLIVAATGFLELSSLAFILALMIGLAVSIDYALFIVSRYRGELTDHVDLAPDEAAGRAVGTAGSAVVFAGLTVVIALSSLAVVGIPILTQMGLGAALTVAMAVVIALTLMPALLGFAGPRVMSRRFDRRLELELEVQHERGWLRWAAAVTRRPVPVLIGATAILLLVAVPALDLRLGLPDDGTADTETTQRKAYDLISQKFGPGFNGPLTIIVDATGNADPAASVAAETVAGRIAALEGVLLVAPARLNAAGDTALLTVIPSGDPSSEATARLVAEIRGTATDLEAATGAEVAVTGLTAIAIDVSRKLSDALLPYLALVVGLAFLLLMLAFRSILVPLTAALGFVLTIAATFGVVVAVFQWGWFADVFGATPAPIVSVLPIFLIGVIFGLAMDYQVFLVMRMREEHVHGLRAARAVVVGFGHGARVVAAAAIIMMGVFGGFILAEDSLVRSIGLAFAVAVLFDAFVVRMTIVPAVMALLGERAWWLPSWLDRILPNVDIEGAGLEHRVLAREAADQREAATEPA
ncbi:MAG: MMPL family transporter [Candidatus Limnocylindrales bacterium]